MPSTTIQIADAVVDSAQRRHLEPAGCGRRHYLPEFELTEMDALHVSVVPAELDEEIADRTRDRAEYKIHVAVQKRVGRQDPPGIDTEAIDQLMQLVEEMDDLFRHKPLAGFEQAHWVKTENKPIYDPKAPQGARAVYQPFGVHLPDCAMSLSYDVKSMFFDRRAVAEAVGRANVKVLSRIGAFIRRRAKSSIRKRRAASLPGQPPSSHVGTLKNLIYFGFDTATRSVVVGPTPAGVRGIVPPTLEFGGPLAARRNPRRRLRQVGGAGRSASAAIGAPPPSGTRTASG